jgi:hypothetical protein
MFRMASLTLEGLSVGLHGASRRMLSTVRRLDSRR